MNKKNQSWAQNKNIGHFIALCFYIAVGYFFYVAASNMNYVWKWNSIPKYFVYEQTTNIEASTDGKLVLKDDKYFIKGTKTVQLKDLDSSFLLEYKVGEYVYEYDIIASKTQTKIGPILQGLWVTLKISFFAAILTFVIGIIVALMKLSSYVFLKDIATVYITLVRGTPLLVQIFLNLIDSLQGF